MPCEKCNPKALVSCHSNPATDTYNLNIELPAGTYFWRIFTESGNIYAKQFIHDGVSAIVIAAADLPDGFTTKSREFTLDIVADLANGSPIPFTYKEYVTQVDIEIVCTNGSFYPASIEIGLT